MNRAVLISLGALVAIGAITLAIMIKKTGKDETHAAPGTTTTSTSSGGGTATTQRAAPDLPGGSPTLPTGTGDHPTDYAVGDIHVRDHRAGDHAPLDIPPNVHPANGREIPSTLTTQISQRVFDVLKSCATELPAEARGDKPRLEGQIEISIKSGKTTITKATMQPRNVTDGAALTALKSCMEQKSIGLQDNAPDQDDLDAYTINLSYAIP